MFLGTFAASCGSPGLDKGEEDEPKVIITGDNSSTTGNGSTGSGSNGETSNDGSSNGETLNNATAAPKISSFQVDSPRITDGQQVTFTAVVTDPDGLEDLSGGTLLDPDTMEPYGSFSTDGAEGTYSLTIQWIDLHGMEAINFRTSDTRRLTAEFADQEGNRARQTIALELHCDGREACDASCGYAQCDGVCMNDEFLREDHCGSCGNACPEGARCEGGTCQCSDLEKVCGGACVYTYDNAEHCGDCDITCAMNRGCDDGLCGCFDAGDCRQGERCVEHEYSINSVRNSCISYDGFRIQGGGKTGFLEVRLNDLWIPVCDGFASTSYQATGLACEELFGTSGSFEERDANVDFRWYPSLYCPEGAASVDECDFTLDWSCSFDDFLYVTCE
jgi:hypothetical protein